MNKRESFPLPVQNPLAKPANRKTSEPKTSPTQQKTKPNDQKPPTLPIEKIEEEPHTAEKSKPLASPRNVNSRESLAKTSLKPKEMTAKVSLNNPTANTNLAESKKVEEKKTLSRSFLNSASSNIKRESNPNPKFTQKTLLTKTKEIKLDKSKTTKPLDSKRSMQISFTNSISEFHENEVNDIAKKLTPKMSIKKVGMSPDRFPTQCPERLVTLPETFETHKTLGSDRDFSAEAAKRFSTTPLKPLRENETKDKKDLQNILSAKRDQTTIPSDDERAQKFFQESTMDSIEGSKVFKDKENASKPGTNIHSFAGINIINAITVTPVIGVNNPYQKSPKNQTSPKAFGTTAPNFAHTATSAVRTPNHKPISSLKPTKQPARSNSKRSEEREVGKALSSRLTMGSFVETSKNTVSPEPKRLTPKGNDTLSKLGKKAATQISLKATMSPKASSTSNKYPVGKFVQKTGVTLIADSNSKTL